MNLHQRLPIFSSTEGKKKQKMHKVQSVVDLSSISRESYSVIDNHLPKQNKVIEQPRHENDENVSIYSLFSCNDRLFLPVIEPPVVIIQEPLCTLPLLASLAEEENWHSSSENENYDRLDKYLSLVFRAAITTSHQSMCTSVSGDKCVINTGLVRRNTSEYIHAVCIRSDRFWILYDFTSWRNIPHFGFKSVMEPIPVAFGYDRTMFDRNCMIRFHIDNMIASSRENFPNRWDGLNGAELYNLLQGLVEITKQKLSENTQEVVPFINECGDSSNIGYLLPVSFDQDLVIVLRKIGVCYIAHTIVRASQLYAQVRVLNCKSILREMFA
jgi:hypothetical protein